MSSGRPRACAPQPEGCSLSRASQTGERKGSEARAGERRDLKATQARAKVVMRFPRLEHPVFELRRKLHSALRTGRRLHLDPEQMRVLFDRRVLEALSQIEAEELERLCAPATANVTKSAGSGSIKGRIRSSGPSAGSNQSPPATPEEQSPAARQSMLAAALQIGRPKKP